MIAKGNRDSKGKQNVAKRRGTGRSILRTVSSGFRQTRFASGLDYSHQVTRTAPSDLASVVTGCFVFFLALFFYFAYSVHMLSVPGSIILMKLILVVLQVREGGRVP